MQTPEAVLSRARRSLIPPPRLRLSEWIEANVRLPDGMTAQPGPVRLWPFQREIADAIGDPAIERVTMVKPVRVGFTTLLTSAVASYVANDPAPILCLLPTESDCRDYVVSDVEPLFGATETVRDALKDDTAEGERNTLMSRRFPGGSLKVVAAKSPRNLRRHNVRVLFIDEADGMENTPEGSPILLAERRTMSFPDRKIVIGSTPVHEETSHVLRAYAQSDCRVFEVPCPHCDAFVEMQWAHIRWDDGHPETARFSCPECKAETPETEKPGMVERGRWRALRPEVSGHAGFRLNAMVSLHANASWAKLAREFIAVKSDPTTLQTFINTILGQGWRGEGDEVSDAELMSRAEDIGVEPVPAEVLAMTLGCDVQHDRIEATALGWADEGAPCVLGQWVIWGQWDDDETWAELDRLIARQFSHALGGRITFDAVAIDAGDGATMGRVIDFCGRRRRIVPIKGVDGNRPMFARAQNAKKAGDRLCIVGVDTVKEALFRRLSIPGAMRFSNTLPPVWFEQLASERIVVRYSRGVPKRVFERLQGRRAEALDCVVYAWAVRQMVNPDWNQRRFDLSQPEPQKIVRQKPRDSGWIETRGDWL
jgi:phage terminase large subunit GpA-like protein